MKVFKDHDAGITLDDLFKGDLFEKDCQNPCTMWMVISSHTNAALQMDILKDHILVVDLKNSCVRAMQSKQRVIPLETKGLIVKEK